MSFHVHNNTFHVYNNMNHVYLDEITRSLHAVAAMNSLAYRLAARIVFYERTFNKFALNKLH